MGRALLVAAFGVAGLLLSACGVGADNLAEPPSPTRTNTHRCTPEHRANEPATNKEPEKPVDRRAYRKLEWLNVPDGWHTVGVKDIKDAKSKFKGRENIVGGIANEEVPGSTGTGAGEKFEAWKISATIAALIQIEPEPGDVLAALEKYGKDFEMEFKPMGAKKDGVLASALAGHTILITFSVSRGVYVIEARVGHGNVMEQMTALKQWAKSIKAK